MWSYILKSSSLTIKMQRSEMPLNLEAAGLDLSSKSLNLLLTRDMDASRRLSSLNLSSIFVDLNLLNVDQGDLLLCIKPTGKVA